MGGWFLRYPLGNVDFDGQTYGYRIYIRHAKEDMVPFERLKLLAHELVHVEQFERFGSSYSDFGYEYFREYKRANESYENNDLEEEAYGRVDNDPAFLELLKEEYYATKTPSPLCLVGIEGVLTIRNPTGNKVNYQLRWSEMDAWESYSLDPVYRRTHLVPNGCGEIARSPEIRFDQSFEPGYQERGYQLEYTDQPESPDPSKRPLGMVFYFKQVGNGLDLYRQGSS